MDVLAAVGVRAGSVVCGAVRNRRRAFVEADARAADRKLETAMLTHALERGVLILTLDVEPSSKDRDGAAALPWGPGLHVLPAGFSWRKG